MTVNTVRIPTGAFNVYADTLLSVGLIRYRIVIHGFIDGFSRLIVGMRANPDNTPETVLRLFLDAIEEHGCPSRCRGDHGWENILVAAFMESEDGQGPNRGSYIFGR